LWKGDGPSMEDKSKKNTLYNQQGKGMCVVTKRVRWQRVGNIGEGGGKKRRDLQYKGNTKITVRGALG